MMVVMVMAVVAMLWSRTRGTRQHGNRHQTQQQREKLGAPRTHNDSPEYASEEAYLTKLS
jgi:hypothetical protein